MPAGRRYCGSPWCALGALLLLSSTASAGPDAVETLRAALRSSLEPEARALQARRCIEQLKTIGELRRALTLPEWQNDSTAKDDLPLRQWIGERFAQTVRDGLDQRDAGQQASIVEMLGLMGEAVAPGDPVAVVLRRLAPDVAKMVTQGEVPVQIAAGRALGRMHAEPAVAVPALAGLLHGPTAGREAGADGLLALVKSACRPPSLGGNSLAVLTGAGEAIAACKVAASPVGEALQDGRIAVRRNCAETLVVASHHAAQLVELLLSAQQICPDQDYRRQIEARATDLWPMLHALGEAMPALSAALGDDDPVVRQSCGRALVDLTAARKRWRQRPGGDDPMASGLVGSRYFLTRALSHPDVALRREVLEVLESLGADASFAVPGLVQASADRDRFVRWSAVRALGDVAVKPDAAVLTALSERLADPDTDVRRRAMASLEKLAEAGGPTADYRVAMAALGNVMLEQGLDLRLGAIRALRKMGESARAALPVVAEMLKDQNPEVRREAAATLGEFGPVSRPFVPVLKRALHDEAGEVRDAAREAILRVSMEGK